jgi:hypothetical protein
MRVLKISALLLACSAGAFALAPARAQMAEQKGPQARIERMCANTGMSDKMAEMQTKRAAILAIQLSLTDAQKAAYKEFQDARTKARTEGRTALCANKPDLSTFASRIAFRQVMAQRRLDTMKAVDPKLVAFYNTLDDKQKAEFEKLLKSSAKKRMEGRGPAMLGPGMMGGPAMTSPAPKAPDPATPEPDDSDIE